jgi:cobalamin biosynthesis protein CobT
MKIYKGYQFKSAVAELILKIGKDLGRDVTINWCSRTVTAGINGRGEIRLADVADDATLTHNDLVKYCGFGVHELLHSLFTNFNINADPCSEQYICELHNAIEDAFIEREGIARSTTGNIRNLLTVLVEGMVAKALTAVSDWADPRQYPFVLAIYLRDHASTKIPLANGLAPIFDEAKVRLASCKNSGDTLVLARWVNDELLKLQKPSPKPQKRPTRPSNDESKGEGTPEGDKPVGDAVSPEGVVAESAEPSLDAPEGKGGAGAYDESDVIDKGMHQAQVWMKSDVIVPAKLRYSVRKLFEDSGISEFQRNRKSGAVNIHALPTVAYNDKLFKRRNEVDGIDSAVVLLLDVSASMFMDGDYDPKFGFSTRIVTATQACIALLDTLTRAQVATSVLTFGGGVAVQKPFDAPLKRGIESLRKLQDGGGTQDYFAVRYAHKLLLNRPEQRKICFVLTDGDGQVNKTREQVEIGERLGVTTIGLGIEHFVGHVYPQHCSVKDLSELGTVSFKQIKLAA